MKEAKEIVDIPGDRLKQMGLVAYAKTTYFTAIAQLDDRLITIIDPTILVRSLDGIKQIQSYMKELKAKQMT